MTSAFDTVNHSILLDRLRISFGFTNTVLSGLTLISATDINMSDTVALSLLSLLSHVESPKDPF